MYENLINFELYNITWFMQYNNFLTDNPSKQFCIKFSFALFADGPSEESAGEK